MGYLSVTRFWDYQNADVWKKAKGHPPWFKHYVHHDRELDELPNDARLLYYELLAAATRNGNVLKATLKRSGSEVNEDLKWLCAETRMEAEAIAEHLPTLLKGGWLSETRTPRRSRKPSRKTLESSLEPKEEEVEEDKERPLPLLRAVEDPAERKAAAEAALAKINERLGNTSMTDIGRGVG